MFPRLSVLLMPLLATHPGLISFIVAMFSEELLFFLAILSGSGAFPFFVLFGFGFIGIILADCVCFLLGRTRIIQYLRKNHFSSKKYKSLRGTLARFSENKFVFIITSKFVYGTRAAAAIVLGAKGMNFGKFLLFDITAVIIWESVMLPIAWLSGRGIHAFFKITRGFEKFLLVALLLVVLYHLIIKNIAKNYGTRAAK